MRTFALLIALSVATPALAQTRSSAATERKPTEEEKAAAAAAGFTILGMSGLALLCMGISSFLVYMAPTGIAILRKHPNIAPILIVNFFLGWSLIGWVVAMAWAFTVQEPRRTQRRSSGRDEAPNPFD